MPVPILPPPTTTWAWSGSASKITARPSRVTGRRSASGPTSPRRITTWPSPCSSRATSRRGWRRWTRPCGSSPISPSRHLNRAVTWLRMGRFEHGLARIRVAAAVRELSHRAASRAAVGRPAPAGALRAAAQRARAGRHDPIHSLRPAGEAALRQRDPAVPAGIGAAACRAARASIA